MMKKMIPFCMVLCSLLGYGQTDKSPIVRAGFGYSLTDNDGIYRSPWSVYADYRVMKWDQLSLAAGFRMFYFSSEVPDNFPNHFGYNPYVNGSYALESTKIQANLGLGYYFHSYEFTPTQSGVFNNPKRTIRTNGFTVTPGLQYFVYRTFFLDANATFLIATTKDDYAKDSSANQTFIQLGLGLVF